MNFLSNHACITFVALLLAGAGQTTFGDNKSDAALPASMTGSWKGEARIVVAWCQQTNLTVEVQIARDGTVTGKAGDAALRGGKFKPNRGWLGRKLNLKTDYIITGHLEGPLIAAEAISRDAINIPLNFSNGKFTGGVHSSGTHIGGRKQMALSAASLTLTRQIEP